MTRAPRPRGFTLLEVMIALAILAASLVLVSDVVGGALRNHVRARQLEVATTLARGKMAELEDRYEAKGFRDFDESDDGTFEDDGHPEVHWKLEVRVPTVGLGPDQVLQALTGSGGGLQELLPPELIPAIGPAQGVVNATLQRILTRIGEDVKKGVREVRLTVSWADGGPEESFTVVTDMVVVQPTQPTGGPG